MAPVLLLLQTVFASILEVFLLCLAGYVLARRGILDKKTQKQINRLNVSLFTPSLLFSKVAFFLSPAKLRELWIIPIVFVVVTTTSMSVAYFLGWIFRLKKPQRSFAVAATMFMNSNSLPIALMQSLVVTVSGLKWDDDDTKSAMLGRALTYLVLYSTMGMILRWSYGVHLLSQADPDSAVTTAEPETETSHLLAPDDSTIHDDSHEETSAPSTLRNRPPSLVYTDADESGSSTDLTCGIINGELQGLDHDASQLRTDTKGHNNRVFYSFPNTPSRSTEQLDANYTPVPDGDSENEDDEPLGRRQVSTPTSSRMQSFFRRLRHRIWKALKMVNEFMTVPLWAALASLIVALIQPLQHILDEHSMPVKGALSAAGNCSIPLTLVVLGAYFHAPGSEGAGSGKIAALPQTRDRSRRTSRTTTASEASLVGSVRSMFMLSRLNRSPSGSGLKKEKTLPGETKTVVIAVMSRMIIVPVLLLPLMALSAKFDIPKVFDDPVFVVSNVLLISSPPALTLAQITQAASGDAFERLISRTIFWAYCIITPPATIVYVVIGLLLAKL